MSDVHRPRPLCDAPGGSAGRLAFSLASIVAALGAVILVPTLDTATAAGEAEDPEAAIFPTLPGSSPVRLDGEISVDGRSLSTSIVRLDAPPDEVISFLRRHYEVLPVDLLEEAQKDRRILTVWDVHQGRRLLLSAQLLRSGGTELIRSWSPIQPVSAPMQHAELPRLPEELRPISRIDDRLGGLLVTTSSYASEREASDLAKELAAGLQADGWQGGQVRSAEDSPTLILHFQRGEEQLLASLEVAAGFGTFVSLRLDRHVGAESAAEQSE